MAAACAEEAVRVADPSLSVLWAGARCGWMPGVAFAETPRQSRGKKSFICRMTVRLFTFIRRRRRLPFLNSSATLKKITVGDQCSVMTRGNSHFFRARAHWNTSGPARPILMYTRKGGRAIGFGAIFVD